MTDEDLKELKGIKKLDWLDLAYVPITDAGVKHLKELKNLKSLMLIGTNISDEGVSELKTALQECKITRNVSFGSSNR